MTAPLRHTASLVFMRLGAKLLFTKEGEHVANL